MGKFNKTGRSNYSFQFTCEPRQVDELIQSFLMNNNFKPTNKHGDSYYVRKGLTSTDGFKYYINGNCVQIQAFEAGVFQDMPLEQSGATILNGPAAIAIEGYKNKLKPLFAQLENLNIPVANESMITPAKQDEKVEILKQETEEKEQSNEVEKENDVVDEQNYNKNTDEKNNSTNGGSNINQEQNGNNQNFNNGMNGGYPNNQNFNNGMNGGYPNNQNFNNGMNRGYPNGQYFNQNNNNDTLVTVGFVASIFGLFLAFAGYIIGIPIFMFDFYSASLGMNTNKRGLAIATIVLSSISIFIMIVNIIGIFA